MVKYTKVDDGSGLEGIELAPLTEEDQIAHVKEMMTPLLDAVAVPVEAISIPRLKNWIGIVFCVFILLVVGMKIGCEEPGIRRKNSL